MKKLEKIIANLGVYEDLISVYDDTHISIQASPLFGIKLHFEKASQTAIAYYFTVRTSSWTYDRERSDLHDIISLCFAIFLKSRDSIFASLVIISEDHPFCDNEIYCRYIIPDKNGIIDYNDVDFIEKLISISDYFGRFLGITQGIFDSDFPERCTCDCLCANVFKELTQENVDIKIRNFPKWEYYRDIENNISILHASEIVEFLKAVIEQYKAYNILNGISSKLFIYDDSGYCISHSTSKCIKQYLLSLNEEIESYFFFENMIIIFCKDLLMSIHTPCGGTIYKTEENLLRQRHISEYNLLFKPKSIEWNDIINPILFEDLIYDLLQRNRYITSLRKVSHTNERDGGRDIIADWTIPKSKIENDSQVYESKRIIIQCKAYKNGVSKTDVLDIRDTVENYDSHGYFLAVSSYTKASLTDHLDKLKRDGKIWVDWWTQNEINEEILKYPDIILKYKSLFTVSDMIYN